MKLCKSCSERKSEIVHYGKGLTYRDIELPSGNVCHDCMKEIKTSIKKFKIWEHVLTTKLALLDEIKKLRKALYKACERLCDGSVWADGSMEFYEMCKLAKHSHPFLAAGESDEEQC